MQSSMVHSDLPKSQKCFAAYQDLLESFPRPLLLSVPLSCWFDSLRPRTLDFDLQAFLEYSARIIISVQNNVSHSPNVHPYSSMHHG